MPGPSKTLIGSLSYLGSVPVGVVGDFMVDTYTTGKVRRISPEAPVSVLHVERQETRPGGAGNVALNLVSLGLSVSAMGRVGADAAGVAIRHSLENEGVSTTGFVVQNTFPTPIKNRLIAEAQQILRVDVETVMPMTREVEESVIAAIPTTFHDVKIIAISDYGKGFLSERILEALLRYGERRKIPVIVDPKGGDFSKYRGATILKPNLHEAYAAARLPTTAPLAEVAHVLFAITDTEQLIITRSEEGISLFSRDGEHTEFPVQSREVKDVTGAGDTVLAMISAALANGLDIRSSVRLANIAAGIAIERLGCARITLADLAERLLETDVENKIFDEEHLVALQQVLKGKRYVLLGLDSRHGMSTALFRTIRALSSLEHAEERQLIVYVRDQLPDEEFVSLLASLTEVDFVVCKCESLKSLSEMIHPDEILGLDGDQLVHMSSASELTYTTHS